MQNESPCKIPCLSWIGPILSFLSLIVTSNVTDHFPVVFLMKLAIFVGMLYISKLTVSHSWLIESKAFSTSIHVHERFFFLSLTSSSVVSFAAVFCEGDYIQCRFINYQVVCASHCARSTSSLVYLHILVFV